MPEPLPPQQAGLRADQPEIEDEGRAPSAGPLTNAVVAFTVIALGAAALVGAWRLGVGSPERPGSGTWPLIVGLALVVLGVALALRSRRDQDTEVFTRASAVVPAGLATMIGFVALIETIGFELPSLALMVIWLRFFGHESWRSTAVTSLAAVVAFYLVFVAALAVPIPHLF
ncbi:hypothetical protein Kisp01_35560 [Kineosporia sp. NBRC 101677]|uniref:tripartite tricarboxylate transporter TctB family protein n=1 Tax=Kineosporia sp. NBRC 101677 TaxID=3032197 RepID=UPI0024A575DF|nr:tripartite tricarboxylate transporter TctB family protein [Kineosporia sp. NBRC 101677]GLY16541.1 hypothetical protein Kisp01_35560 [Kineosporia sp. NBRC 101677]